MPENQLVELQEKLERHCNVLPVFVFISAKYDINLIKSYLLPFLIDERKMEPTVIRQTKHFVSFNFDDVQLPDIMNFLSGEQASTRLLKLIKQQKPKIFSH